MLITKVDAEVLRAALKRRGTWYVNASNGAPTHFIHGNCISNLTVSDRLAINFEQIDSKPLDAPLPSPVQVYLPDRTIYQSYNPQVRSYAALLGLRVE